MKYTPIDQALFVTNRARFTAQMKPNTIAIFNSNDQMPFSGDAYFPLHQNRDLFWLCGIDQEHTQLVLYPDAPRSGTYKEILIIMRTNDYIARWEGHKYTKEEAQAASGIERVLFADEAGVTLNELILNADGIYVNTNENDRFKSDVVSADHRYIQQLRQRYPAHTLHRAQQIIKTLRVIKTPLEVELLQKAIDITEKAFRRVLHFVQPGVTEYEIEAEITHEFLRNRGTGHGYTPIIASGAGACVLHYIENNRPCLDGDVLLMDFGCEYANYSADLTRSIPVNGRFSKRQRKVYDSVLHVLVAARDMLRPGNTLEQYHAAVGEAMTEELLKLKLITKEEVAAATPEWPAYKKYFMHGTSHHLGLDVHDLCNRYGVFQEGMVFTVEPGIYIPEENLGIRLENNVVLTAQGAKDLFVNIPIEAEEIEELMAS
jgi:Xaa-Pro aminopeptidase